MMQLPGSRTVLQARYEHFRTIPEGHPFTPQEVAAYHGHIVEGESTATVARHLGITVDHVWAAVLKVGKYCVTKDPSRVFADPDPATLAAYRHILPDLERRMEEARLRRDAVTRNAFVTVEESTKARNDATREFQLIGSALRAVRFLVDPEYRRESTRLRGEW